MEDDRHLMFITLLILAMLAFFVGEANDRAMTERENRKNLPETVGQHISAGLKN